jgi:hypothetical protein
VLHSSNMTVILSREHSGACGRICPNVQRAFVCARMAKEKAPYWRRGSRLYRSSYPEAKRVEADIGMAPFADPRADELTLVAPGTAADHTKVWIAAAEPR